MMMTHRTKFRRLCIWSLALFSLLAMDFVAHADTGLPLPRFVSVRADKAKLRTGPGRRYPVEWIYVRRNMPVQIVAEYDTWRKVRDWQGVEGWLHQSLLTGARHMIVTRDDAMLRRKASAEAAPVARLTSGVMAELQTCPDDSNWCRVQIGRTRGWVTRDTFWGTLPGETIK
jgi:SH3-like domain-containing protein